MEKRSAFAGDTISFYEKQEPELKEITIHEFTKQIIHDYGVTEMYYILEYALQRAGA